MMRIHLFIATTCLWCCTPAEKNSANSINNEQVSQVVLINAEMLDRCKIAELISEISSMGPKAIGVNFMFDRAAESKCDVNLQKAIREAKLVVLPEKLRNDSLTRSAGQFAYHAVATGPNEFFTDDLGQVTSYLRVTTYRDHWLFTFPMQLALQFDSANESRLSLISSPRDYTFERFLESDSIPIISHSDISKYAEMVKGRIVIVGFVGYDGKDEYVLMDGNGAIKRRHMLEIIGGAVLDILRGLDDPKI